MLESCHRDAARRHRVQLIVDESSRLGAPHSDPQGLEYAINDAFGTTSEAFVDTEVSRIINTLRERDQKAPDAKVLNTALAVIDGTRPENETEAMLASQIALTHVLACNMLGRMHRAEYLEHVTAFGNIATKLQRTMVAQLEALAKLKRGGNQVVRVEHVHVYPGGKAIVGNVTHGGAPAMPPEGGGGIDGNDAQSYGTTDSRALALAPGAPMWSPPAGREPVPEAGGEGT